MTDIYHRTGSYDQEELEDELVVMEIKSQTIVTLNPTGRLVWEILDDATAAGDILAQIGAVFPKVAADVLKADIQSVLNTLVAARLVTVAPKGG